MEQTNQTPSAQHVQSKSEGRARRKAGGFALYMKENYSQVKNLPNKDRLKALSEKYKESKQSK